MNSNIIKKLAWGICCAAPLAFTICYVTPAALMAIEKYSAEGRAPDLPTVLIITAFFLAATYGTMIALMVHVYRNGRVPGNSKMLWAIALFLGNILAFPVYWFLHIWSEGGPSGDAGSTRAFRKIIFYVPLAMLIIIIIVGGIYGVKGGSPPEGFIFAWAAVFDVVFFPVLIYLIVKAARNGALPAWKKILWILFIISFNMIAFPIYAACHLRTPGDASA